MDYINTKSSETDKEKNFRQPDRIEEADNGDEIIPFRERFSGYSDEEIVQLCHDGDTMAEEFLLNKYKNFVRSKARSYFLIGADHEDIVQEGMIGLYKAIRDYKQEKLSSFRAFAELCITRQIITAIKTATRQKHIPLNSYVSLNKPLYDEESDRTLLDIIMEGNSGNPEEMIINQENLGNIHRKITRFYPDWSRRSWQPILTEKAIRKSLKPWAAMLNQLIMRCKESKENLKNILKKTAVSDYQKQPFV